MAKSLMDFWTWDLKKIVLLMYVAFSVQINPNFLPGKRCFISYDAILPQTCNDCNFICILNASVSSCTQISYGRGTMKQKRKCEVDLFIMQSDGKKIVDPIKQSALCSRIQMELLRPLRVALVSRGPDTELLVANPVELSGKGRPLVFYDITLALKMLNTGIFSVIPDRPSV